MSHPSTAQNGCSLEDCHTNLFALTDLAGIKWRKLSSSAVFVDPLDDPVLVSFSRCISHDILCAWRRVPRSSSAATVPGEPPRTVELMCNKELWIFWYGEEPSNIRGLLASDLHENDQGSWDNGLTYECRTLLFKALHNLIERCLLSQNFIRIGKWFVQPHGPHSVVTHTDKSNHLSIRFSFFLHGESTVCASIDVRQHPPLRQLHQTHLSHAAHIPPPGLQVLLAPYGLAGTLTGQTYKESDQSTQRSLDEWRQFYVFPPQEDLHLPDASRMPPLVEVVVAGVRMRYPACFVLLTAETEVSLSRLHGINFTPPPIIAPVNTSSSAHSSSAIYAPFTPPMTPVGSTCGAPEPKVGAPASLISGCGLSDPSFEPTIDPEGGMVVGHRLVEKVWQDCTITSGFQQHKHQQPSLISSDKQEQAGSWDFGEPMQRNQCACSRSRAKSRMAKLGMGGGATNPGGGPLLHKMKSEKTEKDKHRRGGQAFHRRNLNAGASRFVEMFQPDMDFAMSRASASQPSQATAVSVPSSDAVFSSGNFKTPPSGSSGGQVSIGNGSVTPNVMTNGFDHQAMDSPHSVGVPSPLISSQLPPSSSIPHNGGDPTMPTLSPHPPSSKNSSGAVLDKDSGGHGHESQDLNTTGHSSMSAANNTSLNSSGSSASSAGATPTPAGAGLHTDTFIGKPASAAAPSSAKAIEGLSSPPPTSYHHQLQQQNPQLGALLSDGLHPTKAETIHTWLDSQLGKHSSPRVLKRPMLPMTGIDEQDDELVTESLYNFDTLNAWLEHPVKRNRVDHHHEPAPQSVSPAVTPASIFGDRHQPEPAPSPRQPPEDPYEFSEESSINGATFGNKRPMRPSREDSFPRPSPFANQKGDEFRKSVDSNSVKEELIGTSLDLSPPEPNGMPGVNPNDPLTPEGSVAPANAADTPAAPNFTTEKDLVASFNDLEKLFDTDDSESSDADPRHTPSPQPPSKLTLEDQKPAIGKGTSLVSSTVASGGPTPHELAKMYPTPPSMDNHQSPPQGEQTCAIDMDGAGHYSVLPYSKMDSASHLIASHYTSAGGHPMLQTASMTDKDWSFVFKPPATCLFESSGKYSPVELPSSRLEPLVLPLYKPVPSPFHHPAIPIIDKHTPHHHQPSHYSNLPSVENPGSVSAGGLRTTSSMAASPAPYTPHGPSVRTPRTPLSAYADLQSPASNSSSVYLSKNSVDNQPTNSQLPEVHSLVVNVLISDSLLNLFKDHNFDSCPICLCNMNIKGADVGLYLPDRSTEEQYRCACGFSAVINRRYCINAGLFYEDEVDITGNRDNRFERQKSSLLAAVTCVEDKEKLSGVEALPEDVLLLLLNQFSALYPGSTVLNTYQKQHPALLHPGQDPINTLEMLDGCESVYSVLEAGRQAMENCSSQRLDDPQQRKYCLHKWPYINSSAKMPTNSQDVVRLLKSLQPLLQDAIQKKRTTRMWESVYTISGPLSWKDFHLLARRGAEETSEPQPIPPVVVGHDKDSLALSPLSITYWDKLLLEPFCRPRDTVYVVICPDNDYILSNVRQFFHELSVMYEQCRFGRHRPFSRIVRDGIMRIGPNAAAKVANKEPSDWFSFIGDSPLAAKLKLYAQVCSFLLAPLLSSELPERGNPFDKLPSSTHQPHKTETTPIPNSGVSSGDLSSGSLHGSQSDISSEDKCDGEGRGEGAEGEYDGFQETPGSAWGATGAGEGGGAEKPPPCLVVYMVEPFSYGEEWEDPKRLSMMGILRCFNDLLHALPPHLRNNTQLQIVPLQSIVDFRKSTSTQSLRSLCLSVYSQSRRLLTHTLAGRSLTGFGPAATGDILLRNPDNEGQAVNVKLYTPPFVLASGSDVPSHMDVCSIDRPVKEHSGVLFLGYCLSEDQHWLMATCTDSRGELLETCTINIDIPNRNRRKKASARKIGLAKLWDFLLGVITKTAMPWRVVIGRFGRLGHGELKGWAGLLSKKNLHQASKQLRESCGMCTVLGVNETPQILSACLVSMEIHSSIHVMPDSVKMEERKSSSAQLHTPRDASCTHILVFPTSATAQAGSSERPADNHNDLGADDDIFDQICEDDEFLEGMQMDIFDMPAVDCDNKNTPPGSPGLMGGNSAANRQSPKNQTGKEGGCDAATMMMCDIQDDAGGLHQQPLAMGFYVSTAKPGPLPRWFWSATPHKEDWCPTCFKAALHIHTAKIQTMQDDFATHPLGGGGASSKDNHPLDSNFTCDVLRYVLETYNALSWLTMDVNTGDRRSCLPAHFVLLMQMYYALRAFV